MKWISGGLFAAAACIVGATPFAAPGVDEAASPIFGIRISPGYRDWGCGLRCPRGRQQQRSSRRSRQRCGDQGVPGREAAVPGRRNHCSDGLELRCVRGKQQGVWPSQSFVAGSPINVQFSVKDSKKWASSAAGGLLNSKMANPLARRCKTCAPCHAPAKANDFVFTHYSPSP